MSLFIFLFVSVVVSCNCCVDVPFLITHSYKTCLAQLMLKNMSSINNYFDAQLME